MKIDQDELQRIKNFLGTKLNGCPVCGHNEMAVSSDVVDPLVYSVCVNCTAVTAFSYKMIKGKLGGKDG